MEILNMSWAPKWVTASDSVGPPGIPPWWVPGLYLITGRHVCSVDLISSHYLQTPAAFISRDSSQKDTGNLKSPYQTSYPRITHIGCKKECSLPHFILNLIVFTRGLVYDKIYCSWWHRSLISTFSSKVRLSHIDYRRRTTTVCFFKITTDFYQQQLKAANQSDWP